MLKMIPHVEVGPWLLRQSVGTTPFIVGRKLATRVLLTRRYLEVDLDVTTCQAAAYIVSVRAALAAWRWPRKMLCVHARVRCCVCVCVCCVL